MDPERYLAGLEPVGWKLGLERMRALSARLGEPQCSYRTLHVVGTNGKSSTTLYTAALLGDAGLLTGACVSPHARRWAERTRIGGAEIGEEAFATAAEEVAAAASAVEAGLPEGERVTQFEAAIAISFVAFRAAGVDAAVVEAGLGGRLDATNVIDSEATALTSVGLDHTDWLGETEAEIAAEKLAVLRPGTPLIVGALEPAIEAQARAAAAAAGSELIVAAEAPAEAFPAGLPAYLRRNAGVAIELVSALMPRPRPQAVARALGSIVLPGRFELVDDEPPTLLDAAHNAEGAAALAAALAERAAGRPVVACCSILADKDVDGFVRALAPALDAVVCTAAEPGPGLGRPGAAPLAPAALAERFAAAGLEATVVEPAGAAIEAARARATRAGGVALCAGSHYLLGAWTRKRDPSSSR